MEFRILGPLEALNGDEVLPLGGGKQRALLAVLLLHAGKTVSSARLVDELWGEEVPETATKMVQIYVSQLRKVLPEGILRTRAPGYLLEIEPVSVDAHRFERLVAEGRGALAAGDPARAVEILGEALALWRGPALAEFDEPFAHAEWPRLAELQLTCREELAEAQLALGRQGDVVGELEGLVARHPLRERLRGQLMLALYRSGRQAEALAVFQTFRRTLDDELGIGPSQALRELERRILQQDPELDLEAQPAAAPPPSPEPLAVEPVAAIDPAAVEPGPVGRERELGRLRRALDEMLAGERRIVFVTGEAGLGKTTLVDAFVQEARSRRELLVAAGQCIEHRGAGEAYMPVLEALGRLAGQGGADVVHILAERAPTWLVQIPWLVEGDELDALRERTLGTTRERMLREMVEALDVLSGATPVVLVLEDLHWSDVSTVDLLAAIAKRREPARLLVIGTSRPPGDDPPHPVHAVIRELRLRWRAVGLVLEPLTPGAIADYLARRLGPDGTPPALAEALHELSRGNPLFMETIVASWIDDGSLVPEGPGWRLAARVEKLALAVPDSVRKLIEERLLRLEEADRELLEAGAVAGPEFSAAAVAAALGQDDVEDRCDALADRGAFIEGRGDEQWPDGTIAGRYAFTHDLMQEVLYGGLPAGRRARLHRRVGERLEQAFGERAGEIAPTLALHFLRGRDPAAAVRSLAGAAEQALGRSAPREAIEHLTAGLGLLGSLPADPGPARSELELQSMLGAALVAIEGWSSERAEEAYERARELCVELGDDDALARALYRLATMHEVRGDYPRAEALLEQGLALEIAPETPGILVDEHELMACTLFHQGVFETALDHAERGLSAYDGRYADAVTAAYGDNPGVACEVWAALSLWFLGRPDSARERALQAVALADDPRRRPGRANALAQAAIVAQLRLDADEAFRFADEALREAEEVGFVYRRAMAAIVRGWARTARGDTCRGIDEIRSGLEMSRATGARMDDGYYLGVLADAYARAGRTEEALAAIDEALGASRDRSRFFYEAELHRLRGELELEGEPALVTAVVRAREQGARSLELRAAVSLARLRQAQGRNEDARQLVAGVYASFDEGFDTADLTAARTLLGQLEAAGVPTADAPTTQGRPSAAEPYARSLIPYARTADGLNIAYQVSGDGPVDVVLVPGFLSHLDKDWEEPRHARFLERLGSFVRLIRFDKRGTGLSDRPPDLPDLETRMDDVRAVMDAVGTERAFLFGYSEGGPMSALFAATYPERVLGLVLYGAYAKRIDPDDDYPWAEPAEKRRDYIAEIAEEWGYDRQMRKLCPSGDEPLRRWWRERCRAAASPGAVRALMEMNSSIDVRHVLSAIRVPTLVVHRTGDEPVRVEEGRYIAGRIPGARFVELSGRDHWIGWEPEQILDVVAPFLADHSEGPAAPQPLGERVLATILVTDIAGSTETLQRLGDRAWADLIESHHQIVRGELARFAGEEVDTAGDGFLTVFDGPARAIRCGLTVTDRLASLGLPVRVGVHTGEVERRGRHVRGIAVHTAARVAGEAEPGEVLVTATTRDLVAGSGLAFSDRGERQLRGLDEPRRLYAAHG